MLDEKKNLKIKKIEYWTEASKDPDIVAPMYALWNAYREQALKELAIRFFNENP